MKKKISTFMIAGILGLLSISAEAQENVGDTPKWISDKGYWVIEGNIHTPLQHSIRFYNHQHVLIGRKDVTGVKLDIRKRKTKMMLKEALESSLLAWEKGQANETNIAKAKP